MSVTAEQVKTYREATGVGMQDAKRILERADRLDRIAELQRRLEGGTSSTEKVVLHGILAILDEMIR
jgi:translation elongation factor EF-Ts